MDLVPLKVIPTDKLKLDMFVHVLGWPTGCVFKYKGTDDKGIHELKTPKTHRVFKTPNRLLYTRKHNPK